MLVNLLPWLGILGHFANAPLNRYNYPQILTALGDIGITKITNMVFSLLICLFD